MSHEHDCEQFDGALWRFVDREMSAREIAEVSGILRECGVCRRRYETRVHETRVLRAVLEDPLGRNAARGEAAGRAASASDPGREAGDGVEFGTLSSIDDAFGGNIVRGFQRRVDAEGLRDLYPQEDHGFEELRDVSASTRQRRWRFATVLAMLFLIPGLVGLGLLVNHHQSRRLGVFSVSSVEGGRVVNDRGAVRLLREAASGARRASTETSIAAGGMGEIERGTTYSVDEDVSLALFLGGRVLAGDDPSGRAATVIIRGPAEFSIHPKATVPSFRALLAFGELSATVDPGVRRDLFEITTPHAFATVVGTVFGLTVSSQGTELRVNRGRVDFSRFGSRRDVETVTPATGAAWIAAHAPSRATETGSTLEGVDRVEDAADASRPASHVEAGTGEAATGDDHRDEGSEGLDEPGETGTPRSGSGRPDLGATAVDQPDLDRPVRD